MRKTRGRWAEWIVDAQQSDMTPGCQKMPAASAPRAAGLAAMAWLTTAVAMHAVPTAFTYQGRLSDGGAAATGVYDLEFTLHGVPTGGAPIRPPVVLDDVPVTGGLFTVQIDFGPGAFDGTTRWLGMGVRHGASTGGFVPLATRQELNSVPASQFALTAGTVVDGSITAGKIAVGAVTTEKLSAGAVTAEKLASGAVSSDKLAPLAVTTGAVADSSITAGKIAAGSVVKSLNGLRDAVNITGTPELTVTPGGQTVQIGVAPGALVRPAEVFPLVLQGDGIGSGLDADFIDGIDSSNLARKTEVEGRVRKTGDNMAGTLNISAPLNEKALVVSGNKGGTGLFEVRNSGTGWLALFGDEADWKVHIDGSGNITSTGHVNAAGGLFASDATIAGNLTVNGTISAGPQPFFQYTEHYGPENARFYRTTHGWSGPDEVESLTIHVPAAGAVQIFAHVTFGGIFRAGAGTTGTVGSTRVSMSFKLVRVTDQGETFLAAGGDTDQEPDVYVYARGSAYRVSRIIPVSAGEEVRLKLYSLTGDGEDQGVLDTGIYATYFPQSHLR